MFDGQMGNGRRDLDHRWGLILLAIVFGCAFACGVARGDQPIRAGVGLQEGVPSEICLVKLVGRHYSYTGTGSFLTDRLILTCAHNVRRQPGEYDMVINVVMNDGTKLTNVVVSKVSNEQDLCLLYVKDRIVPQHDKLVVSSLHGYPNTVFTVGWNPSTKSVERHTGRVEQGRVLSGKDGKQQLFVHRSFICQGMSGGPTLDSLGQIVGVNQSSTLGDNHQDHSVLLSLIQQFID